MTLLQITPAVYGFASEPRTSKTFSPSVFTDKLQVSGQSRGHTLDFISKFALVDTVVVTVQKKNSECWVHDDIF
jgi:hypothetical protein|tara:strand:+ start:2092 stop:2313 length:222 start_codon:yes stop_codon:yes gene_type:complete